MGFSMKAQVSICVDILHLKITMEVAIENYRKLHLSTTEIQLPGARVAQDDYAYISPKAGLQVCGEISIPQLLSSG